MVPISQIRSVLKANHTDDDLQNIRSFLYFLAELELNEYLNCKK